eukprot:7600041-Pyramimonas_sp.AAC.1
MGGRTDVDGVSPEPPALSGNVHAHCNLHPVTHDRRDKESGCVINGSEVGWMVRQELTLFAFSRYPERHLRNPKRSAWCNKGLARPSDISKAAMEVVPQCSEMP